MHKMVEVEAVVSRPAAHAPGAAEGGLGASPEAPDGHRVADAGAHDEAAQLKARPRSTLFTQALSPARPSPGASPLPKSSAVHAASRSGAFPPPPPSG